VKSNSESVHKGTDVRLLCVYCGIGAEFSRTRRSIGSVRKNKTADVLALRSKGDEHMLAIIAAVLIVLWLLGFFAFHVTTAFIHVALLVGLVLLVLHLVSGRTASA
jgi:hypothetical protein